MKSSFVFEQDPYTKVNSTRIFFGSGSIDEPPGKSGLSHLCARALLRGTEKRSFVELTQAIEELGASVRIVSDHQYTEIQFQCLQSRSAEVTTLVQEFLTQPKFDPKEIEIIRKNLIEEIASDIQNPETIASRGSFQTLYAGTSLEHAVEGKVHEIQRISVQDIRDFYQNRLSKSFLVFAATSADTKEKVLNAWEKVIQGAFRSTLSASVLPSYSIQGTRAIIVPKPGIASDPFHLHFNGVHESHPDRLKLEIGNFAFGLDFTSRLSQVIRGKRGWTYGIYSGFRQLLGAKREAVPFSVSSSPASSFTVDAIAETLKLYRSYVKKGITPGEFRYAVKAQQNAYVFTTENGDRKLHHHLVEHLTGRKFLSAKSYHARLDRMKRAQVNEAIATHHSTESYQLIVVGDPDKLHRKLKATKLFDRIEVVDVLL